VTLLTVRREVARSTATRPKVPRNPLTHSKASSKLRLTSEHRSGPFALEIYRVPTAYPFRSVLGMTGDEAAARVISRIQAQVGAAMHQRGGTADVEVDARRRGGRSTPPSSCSEFSGPSSPPLTAKLGVTMMPTVDTAFSRSRMTGEPTRASSIPGSLCEHLSRPSPTLAEVSTPPGQTMRKDS
jgi:hypothetical protein